MREANLRKGGWGFTGAAVALGAAVLALAGCEAKETGPDDGATVAAAPAVAPPVPAATASPDAAKPLASFEGKDSDGDARVTSAEYAIAAQTMFRMMDAAKDGSVTLAELDAAREAIGQRGELSSEKVIAANDSDSDGKLTLSEWVAGANAQFNAMDTNRDGAIDRTEWDAANPAGTSPITAPTARSGPKSGT